MFLFVSLVLLGDQFLVIEAETCNVTELKHACISAFRSPSYPANSPCCKKLYEQKLCLCGYIKDPNLRSYINGPNVMVIRRKCKISAPTC
ncbi:hypothetical protein RND71_040185 [Anisodus tanguticus]|uniref:Bifunctional inhibitor/plant lipid transfer protein/seed storage helical domain-containing protein n=1 Tax=Anisodus tanguticus TaxID=243964 RepID=A0AAE1QX53_9SOLA|nr:hypothetical protein RND71_040185 [Anisodus tanguticus]